jgi:hypothetical protein
MCGQGGVPEDCVKYRSWYMAQLTYSSLSCYVCNESSNKALFFKKKIWKGSVHGLYRDTSREFAEETKENQKVIIQSRFPFSPLFVTSVGIILDTHFAL